MHETTAFRDRTSPTSRLRTPATPEEFRSPMGLVDDVGDYVSPTGLVAKITELAVGVNPLEEAGEWFAGDWEKYAECAEAWGNLAGFCRDLAANIEAGNHELSRTWDGQAADAAHAYFGSLHGHLHGIAGSLESMREQYLVAAHGVWSTAKAVGQLIGTIFDVAATAVIILAAGASASWTGAGVVLGGTLMAAQFVRMGRMWAAATGLMTSLQGTIDGVYGQLAHVGSEVAAALHGFPLPRTRYDHPAV